MGTEPGKDESGGIDSGDSNEREKTEGTERHCPLLPSCVSPGPTVRDEGCKCLAGSLLLHVSLGRAVASSVLDASDYTKRWRSALERC